MKFDFGDFERKIRDLQRRAEELDGTHEIPFSELFGPAFLRKHTDFSSLDEMMAASGFKVETPEDFAAIPDAEWERFITSRTRFHSWEEMQKRAVEEWGARKLGL